MAISMSSPWYRPCSSHIQQIPVSSDVHLLRWYYHDSSVFYVMLTLRLGLLGFFLSLFAFAARLELWRAGDDL